MNDTISVLIVNYHTGRLVRKAINSVLEQDFNGDIEVIVIDNSNDSEDRSEFSNIDKKKVKILVNEKNSGFGAACNTGYAESRGEYILLLNPDSYLYPGALSALHAFISRDEKVGAVSPKIYWDDNKTLVLPPITTPNIYRILFDVIMNRFGFTSRLNSLLSRYTAIKLAKRVASYKQNNLPGSMVLLSRKAIEASGGLFDPRFFMYFEDTDLFTRMRKKGYSLYMEPRAEGVHYHNQSGRNEDSIKHKYIQESFFKYLQKYDKTRLVLLLIGFVYKFIGEYRYRDTESIGSVDKSPELIIPPSIKEGWVMELSPMQSMVPSILYFGKGGTFRVPDDVWKKVRPGQYYARVGRAGSFTTKKRWCWRIDNIQYP